MPYIDKSNNHDPRSPPGFAGVCVAVVVVKLLCWYRFHVVPFLRHSFRVEHSEFVTCIATF